MGRGSGHKNGARFVDVSSDAGGRNVQKVHWKKGDVFTWQNLRAKICVSSFEETLQLKDTNNC